MTSSSRSNASPSSNAPAATHLPPPHAWQASALRDDANWKQRLSPEASKGFRDAVLRALDTGKDLLDLTQDDFPLNAAALRLI